MKKILIATAAVATMALAGCGSTTNSTSGAAADATTPAAAATPADSAGSGTSAESGDSAPSSSLSTSAASLGTMVVDAAGRTVYRYDADKQGASSSACTGGCASAWPAVPAGSVSAGQANGVSGKIGSITGVDGKPQATLDGWPLYYYAEDSAAGDTTGQGVGGTWWVVTPAGDEIKAAPSVSSQSGGHGY